MLKVLFMGTPDFAVPTLEAVHKHFEIVQVITQPDRPSGRGLDLKAPPVKRRALELGLSVTQYEKILPEHHERIRSLGADIGVVVAFGQILKQSFIDLPRLGLINLHSSLLPRWRGAAPIHWALLSGDTTTGVTSMRIAQKLDAGNILLQAETLITNQDTLQTLHDRLANLGSDLIVKTLLGLEAGTLQDRPQDEAKVTYAKKIDKEMEHLDVRESCEMLDRQIRALNPWPGTTIRLKTGEKIKVRSARPHPGITVPVGQMDEKAGMLCLGTSSGVLELLSVQLEGKPPVQVAAFLNGYKGQGRKFPLEIEKNEKNK
jgi:methionyl-tRNA formyltransferase